MADATPALVEIGTRHQAHLERLKSHDVKAYDAFFQQMAKDIRRLLGGRNITEFKKARLNRLLKKVRNDFYDETGKIKDIWREQIVDLGEYEGEFEIKALNQVVEHDFALPSRSQMRSAIFNTPITDIEGPSKGKLLTSFFTNWETSTIERVEGEINAGYYRGSTNPEIVRRIIGSRELGFQDGSLAVVRRHLNGVVRTSVQHAAMKARQEVWQNNADIVKKERIVATLDSRTSTICRTMDGREFALSEGPRPPFHIGCRTTVVAVLDKRFAVLEEGGTRRERDPETGEVGSVPSNETYYGWLKRQPADVQDSIIGTTRGQLLRNGGISSQRFAELQLGRDFRPLTLEEMRALEPVAFNRANINL